MNDILSDEIKIRIFEFDGLLREICGPLGRSLYDDPSIGFSECFWARGSRFLAVSMTVEDAPLQRVSLNPVLMRLCLG